MELLNTLHLKRVNQGYVFNIQIYTHYQVHKMCINLQNCKLVCMLDEEILELFDTQKSTTLFVLRTLFNEKNNFYTFQFLRIL